MRKLPSINLLVSFDAAARHLSFKNAAEELFVTPAAVGHQIRVLEEELQTPLFIRLNRAIALTPEGERYHQQITKALRTIRKSTLDLIERNSQKSLLIHCIPYLTNTLLVPNIKSFKAQYPTLKIGIESKIERAVLSPGQLQIAIRHGKETDDDLCYEEITKVSISPVCSPDYDEFDQPSLIQLSTDRLSWKKWQSDWNIQLPVNEMIHCDGLQAVIEMAEQGLGIAMGYFPVLSPQVAAGRLIFPYPEKVSELAPLYLAYSRQLEDETIIADFISWFKDVVSQFGA